MRKSNKLVAGVGVTDVDYSPVATKCPYYVVWQAMLMRCYSPRMLKKNPTYLGCSVDPAWHSFSTFKSWMMLQDWKNKELDKDLLVHGNKVYGPNTCLFVSSAINCLFNKGKRGDLPTGVVRHNNKFKVTFKKNRKTVHHGVFDTVELAAEAYKNAKADWITEIALKETCVATKQALINVADRHRKGLF